MSRPDWFVETIKKVYPARDLAALMTNLPVVGRIVEFYLFNGDEAFYLPRDNTIRIQETIPEAENLVLPSQIVDHFISKAEHHWIMDDCLCRSSAGCRDYPKNLGCIFLGEAVTEINPQLGRLVNAEEALAHAHTARDAGLVHMIGRNKLDSVWLGAGPAGKLMTICNCCPCCCFYRALPFLTPSISNKIKKMPGVMVQVGDNCSGCGLCTEQIFFVEAIKVENDRAVIGVECRGCGRCVEICPNEAIELTISDWSLTDTLDRLSTQVELA